MNKKGFIHHPMFWGILGGLVVGMVLMYLIAKGIIPLGIKIC
jgi:hypothetical protein